MIIKIIGLNLIRSELNHPHSSERDDNLREMIQDLQKTTLSTIALLDDLLLYEKLETEQLRMNFTFEDPIAMIKDVIQSYNAKIAFQALSSDLNSKRCYIDKARMPVIFNAILNPILQHLPEDQQITIDAEVKCLPKRTLLSGRASNPLQVVPEADLFLVRIKDQFSTRTLQDVQCINEENVNFERMGHEDDKGSGFGLWIATKLIKFHDATICVERDDDLGLTFTLRFPLHVEQSKSNTGLKLSDRFRRTLGERFPVALVGRSSISPKYTSHGMEAPHDNIVLSRSGTSPADGVVHATESSDLKRAPVACSVDAIVGDPVVSLVGRKQALNLLIVDDSSMVRKMTIRLLQELGHICFEANDGSTAISLFEELMSEGTSIDMVLMDNQMPIMMGVDATKYIRQKLKYQGVIIGVTGNVLEQDIAKFIEYGANEVLMKPLKRELFEDCCRRYFFEVI